MLALCLLISAPPQISQLLGSGPVTIARWSGTELKGAETSNCRVVYAARGTFDATIESDPPARLLEGDVFYVTPGMRYTFAVDPRTALAAPPELVLFDVACDMTTMTTRTLRVRTSEHVNHTIANGLGSAAVLLDASNLGHPALAMTRLVMREGAEVPKHVHQDSDEILLVLEGESFMLVDGKATKLVAGDVVRIPKGREHSAKVPKRFVAVQVYAPGGPEQRFKAGPVTK